MMDRLPPHRLFDRSRGYEEDHPGKGPIHTGIRENIVGPVFFEQLRGVSRDVDAQPTDKTQPADDQIREINEELGENLLFVAASPSMRKLHSQIESLAKVDVPILILGETGSGKGIVGRLIHELSNRSENKFARTSCAALDPDMVEPDLFDHQDRSWSRKVAREASPFSLCKNGTLLLEDIEELPTRAQARLLGLLQDELLAGEKRVNVNVRILASTKVDPRTAVLQEKLRKELYYCLSAFTIVVPPLRQRKADIPLLLQYLMNRIAANYGLPTRNFSAVVLQACQSYSWPGNLRELENFVKRYVVSGEREPPSFREESGHSQKMWTPGETTEGDSELFESVPEISASKSLLHTVKEEAERNAISTALQQTRWNRTAAARLLHVSYRTLLYKIQQYDMSPRKF